MIALTETTIGETIAEGVIWKVQRTPAGNWRICYRGDIKRGVTFTWKDDWFKRLVRGIESPDEVDAECERLLQRCSVAVQSVMREA